MDLEISKEQYKKNCEKVLLKGEELIKENENLHVILENLQNQKKQLD